MISSTLCVPVGHIWSQVVWYYSFQTHLKQKQWGRSICTGADQHVHLQWLFYAGPFPLVLLFLMMAALSAKRIVWNGVYSSWSATKWQEVLVFNKLSPDTSCPCFVWSLEMPFLLVTTIPWTTEGARGPWAFRSTGCASAVTLCPFLKQCQTFIQARFLIKRLINFPVYFSNANHPDKYC